MVIYGLAYSITIYGIIIPVSCSYHQTRFLFLMFLFIVFGIKAEKLLSSTRIVDNFVFKLVFILKLRPRLHDCSGSPTQFFKTSGLILWKTEVFAHVLLL